MQSSSATSAARMFSCVYAASTPWPHLLSLTESESRNPIGLRIAY
jgi:hypothetical protein